MADIRQNPVSKDDFTRSSYPEYPISGPWTPPGYGNDNMEVRSTSGGEATVTPSATVAADIWLADAPMDGDECETWGFGVGGAASGIAFRLWLWDTSSPSYFDYRGYRAGIIETSGSTSVSIVRYDNAPPPYGPNPTELVNTSPGPTGNPGYLLFRRNGNDLEVWHDLAGDGSNFVLIQSATDTNYMTGMYPGLGISDVSGFGILGWTDFGGGPRIRRRPQIYRWVTN